jgi:hypothetical protein
LATGKENEKRHGKKQIFSKIPMITDRNQALFAKMSSCGLQEEINTKLKVPKGQI